MHLTPEEINLLVKAAGFAQVAVCDQRFLIGGAFTYCPWCQSSSYHIIYDGLHPVELDQKEILARLIHKPDCQLETYNNLILRLKQFQLDCTEKF